MQFPLADLSETVSQNPALKRDTLFRMMLQAETATQNIASEWDAVSG